MDLHYGSGDVYGYNSYDQVCIAPNSCAQNFSFATIGMQTNLESLQASGLVGLSPNNQETLCDLFIIKMKEAGVIDKAVFSFLIDVKNDRSKMTIGGIDMSLAAPNSTLNYHKINNGSMHWLINITKMEMSGAKNADNYTKYPFGQDKPAIVDSGTSFLLMPMDDRK